jgi:valyl-tRNA synthetase
MYREQDIHDLQSSKKRFETRAGKPEGAEKDWRLMKVGERIAFTAVKPGSEEALPLPPVTKTIVAIKQYPSINEMLKEIPVGEINPGLTAEQYKKQMLSYPGFPERLEKYGVWVIELKDAPEEIYVGIEPPQGEGYEQDPDTLDTWFSSGLWPFSTLGWPHFAPDGASRGKPGPENDFANYFPNTLMAPGYEILQLWVARMILMSGVLLDSIPFKTVLIHGIVRDSKGEKFSKSKGNGIDPLVLADTYGADALRMGLVAGAAPGNDVKFDEQRVKGYRNFSTKIWNIARFIEMNKPSVSSVTPAKAGAHASPEHKKYLSDLVSLKSEITKHLDTFEFHLAGEKLYHYVWHELADVIIEAEKEKLKNGTDEEKAASYAVLEQLLLESLKMLHPFMPFITEEIYQIFRPGKMLMVEKW